MIDRKYWNAWIAAFASFLVSVSAIAKGQPQNPYLPEMSFSAGNVQQGQLVEHDFVLRNPASSVLKIRIVALSHPAMKVKTPQELPPGDTGRIHVTWDTRFVQGDATAEVLLRFNDAETVLVGISAKVIPSVEILPYPAVFLSGFRDEAASTKLDIVNNELVPMNAVGVLSESGASAQGYAATLEPLEPGRRYLLKVELKASAPAGRSHDVIRVLTDNPRLPVIRIPINLFVKDDVYINPESVDFGQIPVGAAEPETFLLKARRGPIKVLSVTSDLSFLKVIMSNPNVAATHEFQIEIEGEPPSGPFSGTIYIRTDDPLFSEVKAPVRGEFLDSGVLRPPLEIPDSR